MCLFILSNELHAQTEEQKNSIIEQRIEQIAGGLEEDATLDYTTLFEDLLYYFEHPLNLNEATIEELRELHMMNDVQVNNLILHISRFGPLRSIYELQSVEAFDIATIREIEPFVTITPGSAIKGISARTIFNEGSHDLFLRYKRNIEDQAGFKPDPETGLPDFKGTPDYLYARYRFQFRKNLIAGFTLENDPGEQLSRGPDFASAHIMYAGEGFIRKAIVGDYQVLFGQGLTFWNGLGFGKSPFVLNVKKNALGLRPYTSVQEGNYLRGGALTLGVKNFELTSFYSTKKIDANLASSSDTLVSDDEGVASSIQLSGLHRTENEISDKGSLGETVYGGNFRYVSRGFSAGVTAAHTEFDKMLSPDQSLYEIHRFAGDNNTNIGFDYQAVLKNTNVFGEFSRSANGGFAAVNGLVASIHPAVAVSIVHRWFEPEYQALRVNVFGENNTTASNEHGLFAGLQAVFTSKWILTAYNDIVRYPWLRFRVDAPSVYHDRLVQLNYKPDRKHEFYIRYRYQQNAQNSDNADLRLSTPVDFDKHNIRLHGAYQAHPNVQMKTRFEWVQWEKGEIKQQGTLIYQDIIFKKMGTPVTLTMRYALFDTQGSVEDPSGWNTRIYAYESDVLYAFSIPPYYGRGMRFYGMIKWDITRKIDLWLRYGTYIYTDRDVISSGDGAIDGNTRSDIHAQVRLRF